MPVSKSKRRKYTPPPKPKPLPAAPWVPVMFFVLLGLGFASIMARYFLGATNVLEFLNNDWFLWGGLGSIALSFGVATQWR